MLTLLPSRLRGAAVAALAAMLMLTAAPERANAWSQDQIDAGVDETLVELFHLQPELRDLYSRAAGVMVLPFLDKGGFLLGATYGEGALVIGDTLDSYWSYGAASLGFQAGWNRVRRVVFFMTPAALKDFVATGSTGTIGADVEVTVLRAGAGVELDSLSEQRPVIAVTFDRKGLLGGASLRAGAYDPIHAF